MHPTHTHLHDKGTDRLARDIAALERLDKTMKLPPPTKANDSARVVIDGTDPFDYAARWGSTDNPEIYNFSSEKQELDARFLTKLEDAILATWARAETTWADCIHLEALRQFVRLLNVPDADHLRAHLVEIGALDPETIIRHDATIEQLRAEVRRAYTGR